MVKAAGLSSNAASEQERKLFEWLWTWHGFWCQMSWRVYFRNCWSNGIFTHKCFLGFYREVWKNENIQCYSVSTEQQFFVDSRGQRRIARLIKAEANSNSDNFIQPKYAEGHLLEDCCSPCPSDFLMYASSRITWQFTKLKWSQTSYFCCLTSSLHSNSQLNSW